jgi:hypothetical protein
MWGDSVQHAMISQLIANHGGLFDSWQPYAPYSSLTVHPGFHILTALLMWLTGQTVLAATLLAGQAVQVLGLLALVPLATRLLKSDWAGVGVVLVVGLLSPLPNGFLNWGRYPQLMGQAILPVAVWLVWRMFDVPHRFDRGTVIALSLCVAGSFLAYYREPHAIVVFTLVALAFLVARLRFASAAWRRILPALAASVCLALLTVLPWLVHLRGSALGEGVDASTTGVDALQAVLSDYQVLITQGPALLSTTLVLASVGAAIWTNIKRRVNPLLIALWGLGMLALPALRLLPLPGVSNVQSFAVLVGLYIPVGLLVGCAVDELLAWFMHAHRGLAWACSILIAVVGAYGLRGQLGVLDPSYRVLAPADLKALAWAKEHTPPNSYFLVDAFTIYDGRSAVGSDGGWWLPLMTERRSTMPPQYPLLAEQPDDPSYNQKVVDVATRIRQQGVTSSPGIALLCHYGITHVYIGQEQGRIGTPAPTPMLSTDALEHSLAFSAIYRQDKVGIFALHPTACR